MPKRNFILASAVISSVYWVGFLAYLIHINSVSSYDVVGAWQNLFDFVLFIILIPHLVLMLVACLFSWAAFLKCKKGLALVSAVLFCPAALLGLIFIKSALITIPLIAFSFVGYSELKKNNDFV